MDESKPKRRRVSLRTLLILVLVLSVGLGWFAYRMRQAERQRKAVKSKESQIVVIAGVVADEEDDLATGTPPASIITVDPGTGEWDTIGRLERRTQAIRVSPDRRALAIVDEEGTWIWNKNANGAMLGSNTYGDPVWSPDGKQLLVSTGDWTSDGWRIETWKIRADGSHRVRLAIPDTHRVLDWSSDGKWLLTTVSHRMTPRRDVKDRLYIMRVDGSQRRCLNADAEVGLMGVFAPDGASIAYRSQDDEWHCRFGVMDLSGANRRLIVQHRPLQTPGAFCWSADGKYLALAVQNWQRMSGGGASQLHDWHIEIYDLAGKRHRTLKPTGTRLYYLVDLEWRQCATQFVPTLPMILHHQNRKRPNRDKLKTHDHPFQTPTISIQPSHVVNRLRGVGGGGGVVWIVGEALLFLIKALFLESQGLCPPIATSAS